MKQKGNSSFGDNLSPEELRMLSSEMSRDSNRPLPPHDNSAPAKARRFVKKNIFFTVCLITVIVALLACAILGIVMFSKKQAGKPSKADFTVYFGKKENTNKNVKIYPYSELMRDDVLYLDMIGIAKYAGLIISGSDSRMKFTASDEHYIQFENEAEYAVINGSRVIMNVPALVSKDRCLIPFDFLKSSLVSGLSLKYDSTDNSITVLRQVYRDTLKEADIYFSAEKFVLAATSELPVTDHVISPSDYNIDISAWLKYIAPENASEYLILVNKQHSISVSQINRVKETDLVTLTKIGVPAKDNSQQLRTDAAYALLAMFQAMTAANPAITEELFVTSSYRTYEYQESLYNTYVSNYMAQGMTREQAEAQASRTSSRPGESEHHTGLCFDFITKSMGGNLDRRFENTLAYAWLKDNAHLYGFILRYPEDKVSVTGYDYEPWHYRFVGRDAAVKIHDAGISLEEYLGQ